MSQPAADVSGESHIEEAASWWAWFGELWGKGRRFYLVRLRKRYVQRMLELRRGECRRCAGCCSIAFRCPHLEGNACRIYEKRYRQCAAFPIDPRDLRRRDCGFHFVTAEQGDCPAEHKERL